MDRPSNEPSQNDLTQPIPVVPVTPPHPNPQPMPAQPIPAQPSYVANATAGRQRVSDANVTAGRPPAVPQPAYVHRFGSIPFYLLARFAAFAIDIFGVAFVVATFGYHATDIGAFVVAGHDANGFATLAGISLGIALLFAFLCESLFGVTLGKAIFALHVRRGNGAHAGAGRIFGRYLLRPIDLLVIGPLLALVTPRHQRIGDFLAGTVVARSRIGPFASLIALVIVVVVGYAQAVYGGGLTSAIGVSAETANYAPALIARVTTAFGVPNALPARIVPATQSTDAVATPAPIASGTVQ